MIYLKRFKFQKLLPKTTNSRIHFSTSSSKWDQRWKDSVQLVKNQMKDPTFYVTNLFLAIGVIGSMMPDELYLRYCYSLSCFGCIITSSNIFHLAKLPANLPSMFWDTFRFIFHTKNILRIWHENAELRLDSHHEQLYNNHFCDMGLKPRQFLTILQNAKVKTYRDGDMLMHENTLYDESNAKLYLLIDGDIDIIRGGQYFTSIKSTEPLCFIGDGICLDLQEKDLFLRKISNSSKSQYSEYMADINDNANGSKLSSDASSSYVNVNNATMSTTHVAAPVYTKSIGDAVVPSGKTVTVLEWNGKYVVDMMSQGDDIAIKMQKLLYASVRLKLKMLCMNSYRQTYFSILQGILIDGKITQIDKKFLNDFRATNNISFEDHKKDLHELGWTMQDYVKGYQIKDGVSSTLSDHTNTTTVITPVINSSLSDAYDRLLSRCIQDGIVNEVEKSVLAMYRYDNHIDPEYHELALKKLGWSSEEFTRGMKKTTITFGGIISPTAIMNNVNADSHTNTPGATATSLDSPQKSAITHLDNRTNSEKN